MTRTQTARLLSTCSSSRTAPPPDLPCSTRCATARPGTRGTSASRSLVPNTARGLHRVVDPEDTDRAARARRSTRRCRCCREAAGSRVEGILGDPSPLTAVEDAVNAGDVRRDPHLDAAAHGVALAAAGPAAQGRRTRPAGHDDHARRPAGQAALGRSRDRHELARRDGKPLTVPTC